MKHVWCFSVRIFSHSLFLILWMSTRGQCFVAFVLTGSHRQAGCGDLQKEITLKENFSWLLSSYTPLKYIHHIDPLMRSHNMATMRARSII